MAERERLRPNSGIPQTRTARAGGGMLIDFAHAPIPLDRVVDVDGDVGGGEKIIADRHRRRGREGGRKAVLYKTHGWQEGQQSLQETLHSIHVCRWERTLRVSRLV